MLKVKLFKTVQITKGLPQSKTQINSITLMKLACEEKYVFTAIEHLRDLEARKDKRTKERIAARKLSKEKGCRDYDWLDLTMNGKLKKITISDLEKYLNYNSLSKKGRKDDKVKTIMCHVLRHRNFGRDKRETISGEEESDSDEETAIIPAPLDSDEEREDSDNENSNCVNVTNIAVDKETFMGQHYSVEFLN